MQRQWVHWVAMVATAMLLVACGSSAPRRMDVNSDIPTPVVEKLPLTAGVVFDEQLTRYSTTEQQQNGTKWHIGLGNTNRKVLSNIFSSLFENVIELPDPESAASSTPAVEFTLVPRIDDYSMLSAGDAGGKFYAVSMRHFIDIYNPAGERAGTMEVNSYGRHRKSGPMTNGMSEIDAATDDAVRDLAVTLVVELPGRLNQAGLTGAEVDDAETDSESTQ